MTAHECGDDGSCGYVRPGAVAYRESLTYLQTDALLLTGP